VILRVFDQIGIVLEGTTVDCVVAGGPSWARSLSRGDVIIRVDGRAATKDNIAELLVGDDTPGTTVTITVTTQVCNFSPSPVRLSEASSISSRSSRIPVCLRHSLPINKPTSVSHTCFLWQREASRASDESIAACRMHRLGT
jgi:hypothetical protein